MTTPQQIDATLDAVALKQFVWKSERLKAVACAIVKQLLTDGSEGWPDEFLYKDLAKEDCNCVGMAFRFLAKNRIITQTGRHKRSQGDKSHGRIIWQYRIDSAALANTFLQRNGAHALQLRQQELMQ